MRDYCESAETGTSQVFRCAEVINRDQQYLRGKAFEFGAHYLKTFYCVYVLLFCSVFIINCLTSYEDTVLGLLCCLCVK